VKQSNQLFHYVNADGQEITVRQGVVVPDNHKDVIGHEALFDDLSVDEPQPAPRRGRRDS
jgi:hypothetical protein